MEDPLIINFLRAKSDVVAALFCFFLMVLSVQVCLSLIPEMVLRKMI